MFFNVFIRNICILIVFVMFPSEQGLRLGLQKKKREMIHSRKEDIYLIIIGELDFQRVCDVVTRKLKFSVFVICFQKNIRILSLSYSISTRK